MLTKGIITLSILVGFMLPCHADETLARSCARKIFQTHVAKYAATKAGQDNFLQYIHIRAIEPHRLVNSAIQFYEAQWTLERPSKRALIAVEGDSCRLIAGDLDELLDIVIPYEDRWEYTVVQYNNAVRSAAVALDTDKAVIEYGFFVVSLLDPYVRVRRQPRIELLWSQASVEQLWNTSTKGCNKPEKRRKKAFKDALEYFTEPTVTVGFGVRVARFCTWMSVGGTVLSNTVYILDNGNVSISTELLVTHLGPHDDKPSRNRPVD